jgi:glutamate--cysteine ligase
LHCLLSDSPPDSPAEIADLKYNQHHTAARGREAGLKLKRAGTEIALSEWAEELLIECLPIAAALDSAHRSSDYSAALATATIRLGDSNETPSAKVLAAMKTSHQNSFVNFIRSQSFRTRETLLALPWEAAQQTRFEALTQKSIADQRAIEAADTLGFEAFRQQYMSVTNIVS